MGFCTSRPYRNLGTTYVFHIFISTTGDIPDRAWRPNPNNAYIVCLPIFRDRPFNLKGGLWFFVSFRIFFSDNTRDRILFFFVALSANFFFQNSTLSYMTKMLNQIIIFSSAKIRIFFSATLRIRIFS